MSGRQITNRITVFMWALIISLSGPRAIKAGASETGTQTQVQEAQDEDAIVYTDGPTGFRLVKGRTYYYVNNIMKTGWQTIAGKRYYFSTAGNNRGAMVTGKRCLGKKWYFLDPYMKKGLIETGSKVYYANDSGVLKSGWRTIEGKKWYFTADKNRRFERLTGLQKIGKKWYFLSPEPRTGFFTEGGHLYYANGNGEMQSGWRNLNGKTYYFFGGTVNGHVHHEAARGKKSINGTFYIFDKEEGWQKFGLQEYEGAFYYAGNKGKLQTGWHTVNGKRMYFDPGGNNKFKGHNGMLTIKKQTYLLKDGILLYGVNDWNGEYYYTNSKGILETGWKTVDGKTYYFLPQKNGSQPAKAAARGYYTMGDTSYFFDEEGVMDPDKTLFVGMHQVNGVWHYYYPSDGDGHKRGDKATGQIWYKGACYAYDALGDPLTGWQRIGGDYAWFDEKGMYVQSRAAMKLTIIDYGNTKGSYGANYGDPALLESNGEYMLVETCMPEGSKVIIKKLKEMGVKRLSVYISHYHQDHDGALPKILRDPYFTVQKIYMPNTSYMYGDNKDTKWFQTGRGPMEEALKLAEEKGVPVITLEMGDSFKVGFVDASVLYSQYNQNFTGNASDHGQVTTYINNQSLVTRFRCGSVTFLHGGDIEKEAEEEILAKGIDLSADIFKLSHHGGAGSNLTEFLKAVGADIYFYSNPGDTSSLRQNGWSSGIINTAQSMGGNVFHPIVNGTTSFSVSGGSIFIKPSRRGKTVNVNVVNKLSGANETIKVTVQGAKRGTYRIHENMIPFYYDLR